MSLSRTDRRITFRPIRFGRWILALLLLLAAIAASFALYVRSADSGYRNDRNRAVSQALGQGGLAQVDQASSYTWEETMWIVQGKDNEGEAWMLWERSADDIYSIKLSDSYSEEQMLGQFGLQRPAAELVRIQPGWFNDAPVWEVRYRQSQGSDKQSIDFYSFKEGTLIRTYDLPGR